MLMFIHIGNINECEMRKKSFFVFSFTQEQHSIHPLRFLGIFTLFTGPLAVNTPKAQ